MNKYILQIMQNQIKIMYALMPKLETLSHRDEMSKGIGDTERLINNWFQDDLKSKGIIEK